MCTEKIIMSQASFGNHVPRFELVRSDGSKSICSVDENPEMYHATIGGMGLTGLDHLGRSTVAAHCVTQDSLHGDQVQRH